MTTDNNSVPRWELKGNYGECVKNSNIGRYVLFTDHENIIKHIEDKLDKVVNAAHKVNVKLIGEADEIRKSLAASRADMDVLKEILAHAGVLALAARKLVGGPEFTAGSFLQSCPIDKVPYLVKDIRNALDEYDEYILRNFNVSS